MNTTSIELDKIYDLAFNVLKKYGCDEFNAEAVATTVTNAERDGSVSHGLFRIPGYVSSLKSKKVKGNSKPSNIYLSQNAIDQGVGHKENRENGRLKHTCEWGCAYV